MWHKKPDIKNHPSYGYATDDQIERLKVIGICPEYHQIMKAIAEQTKRKGKPK